MKVKKIEIEYLAEKEKLAKKEKFLRSITNQSYLKEVSKILTRLVY